MLLFCCKDKALPYRPIRTDHEAKFNAFVQFANEHATRYAGGDDFAIQFKKQVNFGPIKEVKYFVMNKGFFEEGDEANVKSNYSMGNSYKNYKCCNYFYEINLCLPDKSVSKHHRSTTLGKVYKRDPTNDFARISDKGMRLESKH